MQSVRWADFPQLSMRGSCCPPSWQQYWQQSRRDGPMTARTVQGMARVRSGQAAAWPLVLAGVPVETPLDFDCQAAAGSFTRCDQAVASL